MNGEKRYNIHWTKEYDDGRIIEHKSVKDWPLEKAMHLASAGEKLTKEPHTIKEADKTVPFEVVKNG